MKWTHNMQKRPASANAFPPSTSQYGYKHRHHVGWSISSQYSRQMLLFVYNNHISECSDGYNTFATRMHNTLSVCRNRKSFGCKCWDLCVSLRPKFRHRWQHSNSPPDQLYDHLTTNICSSFLNLPLPPSVCLTYSYSIASSCLQFC